MIIRGLEVFRRGDCDRTALFAFLRPLRVSAGRLGLLLLPLLLGFLGGALSGRLLSPAPALAQTPPEIVRAAGQTMLAKQFFAIEPSGQMRASLDSTGSLTLLRPNGTISLAIFSDTTSGDAIIVRCDRSGECTEL